MAGKGRGRPAGKGPKKVAPPKVKKLDENGKVIRAKIVRPENRLQRQIFSILKQVHPDVTISKPTMNVNDLCLEVYQKLANNACELMRHKGGSSSILSAQDIQGAIKLTIPGELAKHAVNECSRAVAQWALATQKAK